MTVSLPSLSSAKVLEAYNENVYGPVSRLPNEHVFFNASVLVRPGQLLQKAFVRVVDGRITEVGTGAINPDSERAQPHDLDGKWIYPGFIDSWTHLGVPALKKKPQVWPPADGPQYERKNQRAGSWNEAITPEYRVILNANEAEASAIESRRQAGFTVAHVLPNDKIFRGTSLIRDLSGDPLVKSVIEADAAMVLSFEKGSSNQAYPDSLMGAIALIRQTLSDLRYYWQTRSETADQDLVLETLFQQQNSKLPVFFESGDTLSTLRALKLARDFGLKFSVKGDNLEFERAGEISAYKTSLGVIVISPDFPKAYNQKQLPKISKEEQLAKISLRDLRRWEQAPTNAAALGAAQVPFVMSFGQDKTAKEFWEGLHRSLANGLSVDEAVASLTIEAARNLGIENKAGSIEVGKRADFVIASNDLFRRKDSKILETWIKGKKFTEEAKDEEEGEKSKEDSKDEKSKEEKEKPEIEIVAETLISAKTFPNMAYGFEKIPNQDTYLIQNATVWTNGQKGILEKADVLVRQGKIAAIGRELLNADFAEGEEIKVVDGSGLHLTPGIIDEHSHIAIAQGVNEATHSVTSEVRIGDVLDPTDISIYRLLSGGVTTSQLLHGSANSIGGQSALIKHRWGQGAEGIKVENAPKFIKFALGENVKQSNWGDLYQSRYPQTRMGVASVIEDAFQRATAYRDEKKVSQRAGTPFRVDFQMEALEEILGNERFITCHSYVQSEMLALMELAERMGFRVNTFTHVLEGYKIAPEIAAHGASAGTFSDWWAYKFEVRQAIPYNAALMRQAGVNVAINSDDNEQAGRLNQEAAKAIKYGGLSEEEALKLVTLNPAKALHLDNRMGSIEVGKDADIVLWSSNPLTLKARALKTFVDGRLLFDRLQDRVLHGKIDQEKQILWEKMQKGIEKKKYATLKKEDFEKLMTKGPGSEHGMGHQHRCEEIHNDYNQ